MPSVTLTASNPTDLTWGNTTGTYVGGSTALSDGSDATYAQFTVSAGLFGGIVADLTGALPAGAVPIRFTVNLRASSPAGVAFRIELGNDLSGSATPYYNLKNTSIGAAGAANFVETLTAEGGDVMSSADAAAGLVQIAIEPRTVAPYAAGGTIRVYQLTVDVEYGYVTAENIFQLRQTRNLTYSRATTASQPWSLVASEGSTGAGEQVITAQSSTQATWADEYDPYLESGETYTFNGHTIGSDDVSASISLRRFQSTPNPLPRTVRVRVYPTWHYNDNGTDYGGGTFNIYVLATTSFTPTLSGAYLGSDVSSYWLSPGSLGSWTTVATLTATGSATDQASPLPSWASDYDNTLPSAIHNYGTIGGVGYADVSFSWSGAGNLAVCVVDDYWLSGTTPSFPAGDTEPDSSIRRVEAYVDLWVHTGASPMLRVVSADGLDIWRVTPTLPNPDGGLLRLVEADGTKWVQDNAGTKPLTLIAADGTGQITLPMSLDP